MNMKFCTCIEEDRVATKSESSRRMNLNCGNDYTAVPNIHQFPSNGQYKAIIILHDKIALDRKK